MTEEVKQHVFEPFFTTKGPDNGTGHGLPTEYSIVLQAGGRIAIDTAPGGRYDVPHRPPLVRRLAGALGGHLRRRNFPIACRRAAGRSILLVEDEDAVRRLARMTLEACGYAVAEAPDGETALEWLAGGGGHLDLLVTDLTMPGIGGRDLAEQIRLSRPDIAVVFISGYAPDIDRLESVSGSVFLAKPFTPSDLRKAATKAIARMSKAVATWA